jgi:hypothetical protein
VRAPAAASQRAKDSKRTALESTGEQKPIGAERSSLEDVGRGRRPREDWFLECDGLHLEGFLTNWTA